MKENTLLIVDDSPAVRTLIKNAVTENSLFSHILEAQDGMEALKLFFSNKVDFIITDIMMPKVDGYKLISAIKESEAGKDIPVIMLSAGRKGVSDKVKGLEIGASDYLIKPFDSSELLARIIVFIRMQRLQEELKEKNALLEKLSITDELTGIYNRRYFYEYMNMQAALAKRHSYQIGCIMIDVDHFKKINDTFGHDVGDKALKGLARLMKDKIREIKTKDILMLDEPTEGFSTEQLDKIRIVLEQLNIKQVIIVSHETKIESFVDNVIRINKNEQISSIV